MELNLLESVKRIHRLVEVASGQAEECAKGVWIVGTIDRESTIREIQSTRLHLSQIRFSLTSITTIMNNKHLRRKTRARATLGA